MLENEAQPQHVADGDHIRVPCLTTLDEARIDALRAEQRFFWVDLTAPDPTEVTRLGRIFGFHPLAIEDTIHGRQRPKLDDYGDYVFLVFYGARESETDEPLREVHLYVSGNYVVTVHPDHLPALQQERERINERAMRSEQFVVYRVLDALTDTFFPMLAEIDDEIDDIEDSIVTRVDETQLSRIFALKRDLVAMRKVVTPQRDLFARSVDAIAELPGLTLDARDYFRDVYDHLIRVSDLIDSYRDLLSGAMDVYLSTVGNRQNEVMKQLTIIATIFLPLTFITGFFGQNFGWLVNRIGSLGAFLGAGIGCLIVSCLLLVVFFRRRRWL